MEDGLGTAGRSCAPRSRGQLTQGLEACLGTFGRPPVDAVHAEPPEIALAHGGVEPNQGPTPQTPALEVGGVEQVAVRDGDRLDPLLAGVAPCLTQRFVQRRATPGERTGPLCLDDQVLDAEAAQEQVGASHLMAEIPDRPVQHGGEEVLEDLLGCPLGRVAVPRALAEPHRSTDLELGPCSLQVTKAASVGGRFLDLGHRRPIDTTRSWPMAQALRGPTRGASSAGPRRMPSHGRGRRG
jgi:hypothetical protein